MTAESSTNTFEYPLTTPADTKSDPNPTTKQHAVVSIQMQLAE